MNTRKDKENNHDAIQALLEKVAKTHKMLTNGDITEKVERNIISAVSKKFIQDLKSNTSYSSGYIKTIISSIRKQIREHISPDHISLKYIKLSKQEYQEINNETMSRVKESNLNKTAINLSEFDKLTNAFLKSNLEEHLALGIALASGRRIKEVFISNIEDISESNVVLFTGQLKTKSIERFYQGYEIPLTVEKELFFDAYNRFKNSSFIHEIKTKWEEDTLSKEYIYSKLMPEFYKIFKNKFKISDFRAIYATKILDMEGYFKDKSGSKEIYHRVASLLGHKLSEGEIIGASFNYRDFCITKARVIEDLKEKLEYIKQHRQIEINKKMIAFLNKKIATGKLVDISYESDKSKTRIDGSVFNTMNNALQDALDTFKNHDSILMNKNSLNTAFRKILEKEYGYDVRNNGTKTIRFIDKFLSIEKKSKIKLKSISSRKRYNPDIIRNLIIPKEMQPLLEELKSDKSTATLRQDSHIIQFVLEKILIERENK
ncbi:protelomerase family protein [Borrelia sp. RT1S]|uniref:protelomerase family protein n=1 Tax=Borrelia sp. RT1S TaxID=2898580 RepID=UPI001E2F266D|nr:protelomerase family protein [Borrelia sp. RT1S]UGQ17637.1 protelomerase family protein [Borrelia sp. RT1S]